MSPSKRRPPTLRRSRESAGSRGARESPRFRAYDRCARAASHMCEPWAGVRNQLGSTRPPHTNTSPPPQPQPQRRPLPVVHHHHLLAQSVDGGGGPLAVVHCRLWVDGSNFQDQPIDKGNEHKNNPLAGENSSLKQNELLGNYQTPSRPVRCPVQHRVPCLLRHRNKAKDQTTPLLLPVLPPNSLGAWAELERCCPSTAQTVRACQLSPTRNEASCNPFRFRKESAWCRRCGLASEARPFRPPRRRAESPRAVVHSLSRDQLQCTQDHTLVLRGSPIARSWQS